MSNGRDIVARLGRDDVNMPAFRGFPIRYQIVEAEFEAAVYTKLRSDPHIRSSHLIYYRAPSQYYDYMDRTSLPREITGRRLFVFERPAAKQKSWVNLNLEDRMCAILQAARIRAALFNFDLGPEVPTKFLLDRLFPPRPTRFPVPVAPTREFCISLLESKIHATIGEIGDLIGWETYNAVFRVGPVTVAAKQTLLRLVPHILPCGDDEDSLYRFVLDHGDFGDHNMFTTEDENGQPIVESLFDWELGYITPAILSDPQMSVGVWLVVDENAKPSIRHVEASSAIVLFAEAPEYKRAIRAGKDARFLWYALRDWNAQKDDPEIYFGDLGAWAERKLEKLNVPAEDTDNVRIQNQSFTNDKASGTSRTTAGGTSVVIQGLDATIDSTSTYVRKSAALTLPLGPRTPLVEDSLNFPGRKRTSSETDVTVVQAPVPKKQHTDHKSIELPV
ncbi:hypothetical protein H0H92_010399 [Tricholoma furcatifolium]|nr:hypothetical protein H0H92_010399 [Tricholoma furcatifolium]